MLRDEVADEGFALTSTNDRDELLSMARELGTPVAVDDGAYVVELRPRGREEARRRSMTAIFGLAAFPLHTDRAFDVVPPRFTVLRCASAGSGDRPTLLCRPNGASESLWSRLRADIWQVRGRRPFYTSVVSRKTGLLRWDPLIMTPAHERARDTTLSWSDELDRLPTTSIDWTHNLTLVLDNWSVLHARGEARNAVVDSDRVLERIYVCEEAKHE